MKIPFSPPMMGSVLTGHKIATRRVVVTRGAAFERGDIDADRCTDLSVYLKDGREIICPYGATDEVIGIKEYLTVKRVTDGIRCVYTADRAWRDIPFAAMPEDAVIAYQALKLGQTRTVIPRFMRAFFTRAYIRLTTVTNTWLSKMTTLDANEEGFADLPSFHEYWDAINTARGYPVESDPRVWLLKFRLDHVEKPEGILDAAAS